MFADYHMHSHFSNDSSYPLEDLIKKSIAVGLEEICITEHSDYGSMGNYVVDYDAYYKEYSRLKEKYKEQINIKFGCEFGVQAHTIPSYNRDYAMYNFDFIILSNHQIDDLEFWTQKYQENKTQEQYNQGYYQAIFEVIEKFDQYSVLGHLDLIKRYDQEGIYPDQKVEGIITKILKHIIKNNKGLEVNTSSIRYNIPDLTPSKYILKLYKQLGGTILTIGSDTHEEEHVSFYIKEVRRQVRELGFTQFCTFNKMKPIFHDL